MERISMKILLLEDDKYLCNNVKQQLTKEGYIVDACGDGEEGFLLALDRNNSYDLAVIDRMLPIVDGLTIIKAMRNKQIQIPVIIITGMSELQNKIEGLDSGADDYLSKPYDPKEMVARIHSVLRRYNLVKKSDELGLSTYPFVLNKGSREIYFYDELLDLTKAEYEILSFMLENKNQALTRESIASHSDSISPDSGNKSIDVIVGRLRSKIEKNEKKYIVSVRGIGYKLQLKDND